jgi:acetyl-CoA decarbonylase/synthase complex subunit gamma
MALSGIQILKLLPRTNCGECGVPTCLAFSMALAAGKTELAKCPHVSDAAKEALSAAAAPPIRTVALGAGGNRPEIGGETVLFRHEKTFVNKTALGVLVDEAMSDAEVSGRLERFSTMRYLRVGLTLRPELVAVRAATAAGLDRLATIVAEKTDAAIVLMSEDPAALEPVAKKLKDRRPLLHAATEKNADAMAAIATSLGLPLAVRAAGLQAVAELAAKLATKGVKDLVIDAGPASIREAFEQQVHVRRASILGKVKELGYPTICLAFELTDDPDLEAVYAATLIAKYGSAVVMRDLQPHTAFPLLLERLNIYTDPQRPMKTDERIYELNNPGPESPILVTCNFSLTYFIVSGEIEASRVPAYLFVKDTDGLSVLTAWAAGKFSGEDVAAAIKKTGIAEKLTRRRVVVPGLAAVISGDIEEELGAGWEVLIGPREASSIAPFLRQIVA